MFSDSTLLSSATQHFCFVLQAHLFSATTLLHNATTLLFHVASMSVQCFNTSVQCFNTSVQYCTVFSSTYCAASLSFIVTCLCRQILI